MLNRKDKQQELNEPDQYEIWIPSKMHSFASR